MKFEDILKAEIEMFKKGWGNNVDYRTLDENNTQKALKKALGDALKDGARRNKMSYKNDNIEEKFVEFFLKFAKGNNKYDEDQFNEIFDTEVTNFINAMKELNKDKFATYGYGQKFISMSFKYMYCFDSANRKNFSFCKLPLDKYTINWYKKVGKEETKEKFKKIKYAWSNIDTKELYDEIQEDIDNILKKGYDYNVCCGNPAATVRLSKNKLECEFIIWSQERLNDLYKGIRKEYKNYSDRLGITIN